MRHIISWSGGKDSTATVILFYEHEKELIKQGDEVFILFSEVMFDKKKQISGHNPKIIQFIQEKRKIFESWGYHVEILHSDMDFLDTFFHRLTRSSFPERIGKMHGFPLNKCAVKRDCKIKPIEQWIKNCPDAYIQYIGIAVDEPARLRSMSDNTVSLLAKYGFTENDAMCLCEKYNMVSPQYAMEGQTRDGCWFCPYAKLCEHQAIKDMLPEAWKMYVELENIPDLVYPRWNQYTTETLKERDEKLN